mgnify:CR=1 FL=1
MIQDNKMTAVGQLAAGGAHEIRNPLGVIRNYCHLLKKSPPEDEELKAKAIGMMEMAVDRSSEIIDNLLRFSRMSNESWKEVNLNQAIKSILDFEEHTLIKNQIKIILECNEEINICLVPESLEMILINLIINAVDAMEQGGEITINCMEEGETVTITVTDTGEGIPEEIRDKIFKNGFSTKGEHRGTGLYLISDIVNRYHGSLSIDTAIGEGTSITVTL